jgi:hypothetical protein
MQWNCDTQLLSEVPETEFQKLHFKSGSAKVVCTYSVDTCNHVCLAFAQISKVLPEPGDLREAALRPAVRRAPTLYKASPAVHCSFAFVDFASSPSMYHK